MITNPTQIPYRPPTYETNHAKALLTYLAPCVCGREVRWTTTPADGPVPSCTCGEEAAA